MLRYIYIIIIINGTTLIGSAQKEDVHLKLTLNQAIEIAYNQSIFSFRQKNMYLARYWEFRSYKAERLPLLRLGATPINYRNNIISRYDGTKDTLVHNRNLNSNAVLSISQNLILTGGQISVNSTFNRIDQFNSNPISYSSIPISIKMSQPLNGFNKFKWQSKIEPLKFEQAKREYLQSLQDLSEKTTNVFFNVVKAEINLAIAKTNLSNADTLYNIGKGRYEIGTVTQDELLDLELSLLNDNMSLSQAKINLQQARSKINSFLGLDENVKIECVLPSKIPTFKIKLDEVMEKAYENNPQLLNFEQQMITADRDIAKAKSEHGISADIDANIGYNKSSIAFNEVYQTPFGDDQGFSITLNVPIVDWGLKRGQVQMARSNREITEARVRQSKIDFEQDIFLQVMEFNMQEQQVKIAAKANTIAQLGFEVTKQRFLIDKVDVIKLNAARNSLDAAKRNYIQSVQTFWVNYYNMRKLTLFDFENGISLIEDLDYLLQK